MSRFALVWVLALPAVASAQGTRALHLDRLGGFVELGALKLDESRARDDQDTWERDELRFLETLNLQLGGNVYHARLLKWRLGTDLSLQQEVMQGENRVFPAGEAHLAFLEKHPVGVNLDASVAQTQVDRPFARTYDVLSMFYGGTVFGRQIPVPFFVSYGHTRREGGGGNRINEDSDDVTAGAQYQLTGRSRGRFEYQFTDQDVLDRHLRRQRFLATNTTALSADERDRMTANFRAQEQSDVTDTRFYGGTLLFDWRHTPALSSRQQAGAQRTEAGESYINNVDLSASIRHQLYESLISSGGLGFRGEDASFGDQRNYSGHVNEDYTKKLGAWGRFRLALDGQVEYIETRPETGIAFVVDEAVRLDGNTPAELGQQNVDITTVVVTSADGAILYNEGEDYVLVERGFSIEISRVATGDIPDGETVVVDYQYRLLGSGDLFSRTVGAFMSIGFYNAVLVYGRLTVHKQQRVSGDLETLDDQRERQLVGLRLSGPFFTVTGELENTSSRFTRFWSVSEAVSLFVPKARAWHASLNGGHRMARYDDPAEQLDRYTVSASVGARVTDRVRTQVEADYQRERWDSSVERTLSDLDAFGTKASIIWQFRELTADLSGRLSVIDRAGQREEARLIYLRMRRDF